MTAQDFERVGRKIFGKRWKAPLARALGLGPVTVWRYASGQSPIPLAVELALAHLSARCRPAQKKS